MDSQKSVEIMGRDNIGIYNRNNKKNSGTTNTNAITKNERVERTVSQKPDLIKSTFKQIFNFNKTEISNSNKENNLILNESDNEISINSNTDDKINNYYKTNMKRNSKIKEISRSKHGAKNNLNNYNNIILNNNDNTDDDSDSIDHNYINDDIDIDEYLTKNKSTNDNNNGKMEYNKSHHQTTNSIQSNVLKNNEENFNSPNNNVYKNNKRKNHCHINGENIENICKDEKRNFTINIQIDLVSSLLFIVALLTRLYRLSTPNNIVFDELHYGKYVSLYMKNTFFFDQHPPFGKQLIAGLAHMIGYNGNYTFSRIGAEYTKNVPIFWLRLLPALCGSLLSPVTYEVLLEMKLNRWTALLGGLLIIFDNSLLTQSRFILMESMLLLFSTIGILYLLRFQKSKFASSAWLYYGALSAVFLTFAFSVKFSGFYSCILAFLIMTKYLWNLLHDSTISDYQIFLQTITRWMIFTIIPIALYLLIFYVHLNTLYKAGPHDNIMTSAFQASLDGGLASITKGQPLKIAHGSQITLRHTYGRTCWLHSHIHLYPITYSNTRGSSHQQQVTCYSFKDVNNWWIVKRPDRDDLVVGDDPDVIKHGDIIQLVHGITSRGLNSHDVAAPMTPTSQEVSCYIDHNISMAAEMLWKVHIVNRQSEGDTWHAIRSEVRLIHVTSKRLLRFSGKQLPEWGFNQHEIVADSDEEHQDTVWNVEEHRYTKSQDQKERERQLLKAEMIPTKKVFMSFWKKFIELHNKMLWYTDQISSHMYSSDVLDWPFLNKGIAYWIDRDSNGQIHLLGNILIWYSGTISIFIYCTLLGLYLIRRRRLCYDLPEIEWLKFTTVGEIFLGGYILNYLPYFFVDRTLFLHNYLPAFLFKLLLLCYVIEHIHFIIKKFIKIKIFIHLYKIFILVWLIGIFYIYVKYLSISYGIQKLTTDDIIKLRWKDTWDFILRKDLE
ncbi:protein O-mannosyltransferase 1 [Condylostylus longicornis]|uniref:protein O-mannosyltransferase 1 n=1 Tax=Condylostylus longicornis TaxID=2530218 RepID=UPI00244DA31E|nr:protein O-mannosyltransferase 1 [Condylostylus longicornis]